MTAKLPCTRVQDVVRGYFIAADLKQCNRLAVAEMLDTTIHVLQRRLTKEGTSWTQLRHEEQARRLYKYTEQGPKFDILEATEDCGFFTTERFFTFFKSVMGQTFREWRAEVREQGFCDLMSFHEETEGLKHAQ